MARAAKKKQPLRTYVMAKWWRVALMSTIVYLVLLGVPLLFTGFFLRGTLSGGTALLHIPPLFVTGLVLAAFVLPILPESLQTHVQTSQPGKWLLDLNRIIIGGVVVFQLVAFWLLNRLGHKSKH